MFEVQHLTADEVWGNVWTSYHPLDGERPMYFDTREDAMSELVLFFADLKRAVDDGGIPEDHGYRPEDFRVVEIEEQAA